MEAATPFSFIKHGLINHMLFCDVRCFVCKEEEGGGHVKGKKGGSLGGLRREENWEDACK